MNSNIHPSSVISKGAELAPDVYVGPFCVIRGRVRIGAGTRLESHVIIGHDHGDVEIGKNNIFCAGAAVGGPPQDLSYKNETTQLVIGDRNTIREFATISCGTVKGGGITRVGNECLIMAYAHVAHDCFIGNDVVIANSTQLAGHVHFDDHVKVGGMCGFNQHVRVGQYAFIAGGSEVNKDVLPFTQAQGKYAVMRAHNKVGLERAGFVQKDIDAIKTAVRIVTKGGGTIEEALARIQSECTPSTSISHFVDFLKSSTRGVAI